MGRAAARGRRPEEGLSGQELAGAGSACLRPHLAQPGGFRTESKVTAPTTKAAGFNGFPTEAAQPCGHCPASGPLTRRAGEAGGSASDPRTWRKSRRPRTSHREEACPPEPPTPDRRTGRIPRKTARPSYRGRGPAKPPAERGRPSHGCDRAWAFRPQTL